MVLKKTPVKNVSVISSIYWLLSLPIRVFLRLLLYFIKRATVAQVRFLYLLAFVSALIACGGCAGLFLLLAARRISPATSAWSCDLQFDYGTSVATALTPVAPEACRIQRHLLGIHETSTGTAADTLLGAPASVAYSFITTLLSPVALLPPFSLFVSPPPPFGAAAADRGGSADPYAAAVAATVVSEKHAKLLSLYDKQQRDLGAPGHGTAGQMKFVLSDLDGEAPFPTHSESSKKGQSRSKGGQTSSKGAPSGTSGIPQTVWKKDLNGGYKRTILDPEEDGGDYVYNNLGSGIRRRFSLAGGRNRRGRPSVISSIVGFLFSSVSWILSKVAAVVFWPVTLAKALIRMAPLSLGRAPPNYSRFQVPEFLQENSAPFSKLYTTAVERRMIASEYEVNLIVDLAIPDTHQDLFQIRGELFHLNPAEREERMHSEQGMWVENLRQTRKDTNPEYESAGGGQATRRRFSSESEPSAKPGRATDGRRPWRHGSRAADGTMTGLENYEAWLLSGGGKRRRGGYLENERQFRPADDRHLFFKDAGLRWRDEHTDVEESRAGQGAGKRPEKATGRRADDGGPIGERRGADGGRASNQERHSHETLENPGSNSAEAAGFPSGSTAAAGGGRASPVNDRAGGEADRQPPTARKGDVSTRGVREGSFVPTTDEEVCEATGGGGVCKAKSPAEGLQHDGSRETTGAHQRELRERRQYGRVDDAQDDEDKAWGSSGRGRDLRERPRKAASSDATAPGAGRRRRGEPARERWTGGDLDPYDDYYDYDYDEDLMDFDFSGRSPYFASRNTREEAPRRGGGAAARGRRASSDKDSYSFAEEMTSRDRPPAAARERGGGGEADPLEPGLFDESLYVLTQHEVALLAKGSKTHINFGLPLLYRWAKSAVLFPFRVLGLATDGTLTVHFPLIIRFADGANGMPPATHLRVLISSRSSAAGQLPPPPVHWARLRLEPKIGIAQRILSLFRPSCLTSFVAGTFFCLVMIGGAAAAAAFACAAVLLKQWVLRQKKPAPPSGHPGRRPGDQGSSGGGRPLLSQGGAASVESSKPIEMFALPSLPSGSLSAFALLKGGAHRGERGRPPTRPLLNGGKGGVFVPVDEPKEAMIMGDVDVSSSSPPGQGEFFTLAPDVPFPLPVPNVFGILNEKEGPFESYPDLSQEGPDDLVMDLGLWPGANGNPRNANGNSDGSATDALLLSYDPIPPSESADPGQGPYATSARPHRDTGVGKSDRAGSGSLGRTGSPRGSVRMGGPRQGRTKPSDDDTRRHASQELDPTSASKSASSSSSRSRSRSLSPGSSSGSSSWSSSSRTSPLGATPECVPGLGIRRRHGDVGKDKDSDKGRNGVDVGNNEKEEECPAGQGTSGASVSIGEEKKGEAKAVSSVATTDSTTQASVGSSTSGPGAAAEGMPRRNVSSPHSSLVGMLFRGARQRLEKIGFIQATAKSLSSAGILSQGEEGESAEVKRGGVDYKSAEGDILDLEPWGGGERGQDGTSGSSHGPWLRQGIPVDSESSSRTGAGASRGRKGVVPDEGSVAWPFEKKNKGRKPEEFDLVDDEGKPVVDSDEDDEGFADENVGVAPGGFEGSIDGDQTDMYDDGETLDVGILGEGGGSGVEAPSYRNGLRDEVPVE